MNRDDTASDIRAMDDKELAGIPIVTMTDKAFDEDRRRASGIREFLFFRVDLVTQLLQSLGPVPDAAAMDGASRVQCAFKMQIRLPNQHILDDVVSRADCPRSRTLLVICAAVVVGDCWTEPATSCV